MTNKKTNYFSYILQIIIGLLFVFSGLIKANDPLSLSYKIDEFLEIFNLEFIKNVSLIFSLIIINLEILLGVFLILSLKLKTTLRATIYLTIFFTFLTGYAVITNKIKTCGCMGDCIPFSSQQSFIKDLIILIICIYMYIKPSNFKFTFKYKFIIIYVIFLTVILLEFIVLNNKPFIDCLPYKINTDINELIKKSKTKSQTKIYFQYLKNKKIVEFTSDNFPKDFDTTYTYLNRIDKKINNDNNPIVDFILLNSKQIDVTNQILNSNTKQYLLFVKKWDKITTSKKQQLITMLDKKTFFENSIFYLISSEEFVDNKILNNNKSLRLLLCDNVLIKTVSRSNETLYILKNGIILDKMGSLDLNRLIEKSF